MSDTDALPEADRRPGAPHPRMAARVVGHDRAKAEMEAAFRGDMPHAWLLSGPEGVGKATFAWRTARQLLGADGDEARTARIAALSEPSLALIRRSWDDRAKRLKTQITVEDIRKLSGFLSLSAPDGGRRVVIIDAADEMNISAANAVLKLLEEPPAATVFLLVSHNPAQLLPTIRSRCRLLRFDPLTSSELGETLKTIGLDVSARTDALAALAGGSVGRAVGLIELDGLGLYERLVALLATCPSLDRQKALDLASSVAGRGAEAQRDLFLALLDTFLTRLAKHGAGAHDVEFVSETEADVLRRLSPDIAAAHRWADLAQKSNARVAHALGVNLDPAGVILDILLKINETAGRVARP